MKRRISAIIVSSFVILGGVSLPVLGVTDKIHGVTVEDPFRWMENDSPKLEIWKTAQQKRLTDFLTKHKASKETIVRDISAMSNQAKWQSLPSRCGNKNLLEYKVLEKKDRTTLVIKSSISEAGNIVFDPNTLPKNESVTDAVPTFDCKYLALSISKNGSDWRTIKILDIEQKSFLPDTINWAKFTSISWSKDGKGFYYSRFPEPKKGEEILGKHSNHAVFYHTIGTLQSQDTNVFFDATKPDSIYFTTTSSTSDYVLVSASKGSASRKELHVLHKGLPLKHLQIPNVSPWVIGLNGSVLYFCADNANGISNIYSIDLQTNITQPNVVIYGSKRIVGAALTRDTIMVNYLDTIHNAVKIYSHSGRYIRSIHNSKNSAVTWSGSSMADNTAFVQHTSYVKPREYSVVDSGNTALTYYHEYSPFSYNDFKSGFTYVSVRDGTQVPIYVSHKKGIKMDGTNPVVIEAYGSFGKVNTPSFSRSRSYLMNKGVIFVQAHIRGGGELGKSWHDAGKKLNAMNRYYDLIDVTEYLVKHKFTSPSRVAIEGTSSGGLLVLEAANLRPDLFGAVISNVPVTDMLRFQNFSGGKLWTQEFGDISHKAEFEILLKQSPYHNVPKKGKMPHILVMTGEHDTRVVPAHSYKYFAQLEKNTTNSSMRFLRIAKNQGHGGGSLRSEQMEDLAIQYTFLLSVFGLE